MPTAQPLPPSSPSTLFESWLLERPRWLQTAAAALLQHQRLLDTTELNYFADLTVTEAAAEQATFAAVAPGSFDTPSPMSIARLQALECIKGANALRENATLDFGEAAISVVYGANGSGKSSFARVLKQARGPAVAADLVPDVFRAEDVAPSAIIVLERNGAMHSHPWTQAAGPLAALRHMHLFDGRAALTYLTAKNEAAYEPRLMRFVTMLVAVCDSVREVLEERRRVAVRLLPIAPPTLDGTDASAFLAKLRGTVKEPAILKACSYTAEDHQDRLALELALHEKDVAARLIQVAQEKSRLAVVAQRVKAAAVAYAVPQLVELRRLRQVARVKRQIASVDAGKVFAGALQGVGEPAWQAMWNAARAYSETSAYPNLAFPLVAPPAKCVLCQQEISPAAAERMSGFQRFVLGVTETDAKKAEAELAAFVFKFPAISTKETWVPDAEFLGVPPSESVAFFDALAERALEVQAGATATLASGDSAFGAVIHATTVTAERIAVTEKALRELQQEGKRVEMERRLRELRASEWMAQNVGAIRAEVARLASDERIAKGMALTKTNALTALKNELAEEELTKGYQARFAAELEALGGKRLRVKPVAIKEGKGKIVFKLVLDGAVRPAEPNTVLSDGEMRLVALAAFLADITGNGHPTPFVFDDPISSLDQDFEERVVARLVALARTRQVIVFTHRLSLATLLDEAVEHAIDLAKSASTTPDVSIHVQALRRLGSTIGISGSTAPNEVKPKDACNKILEPKTGILARIDQAHADAQVDQFNETMKAACSEFRILLERTVEKILLSDVVGRFRRSIQTLNKIGKLAKITPDDCVQIDSLMTKYSCFEHSQSDETPTWLPDPAEFRADVVALQTWIRLFSAR